MFVSVSERITDRLLRKNIIDQYNQAIYSFGIEQFLTTVLNILTTIVIGVLLGAIWQSLLFVFMFMMLRSYAGGYHASTPVKCYIVTSLIIIIALSVIKYISLNVFIGLGLLIISGVVILILSPVEAENKPLDDIEFVIYRKKAVIVWGIEFLCAIACIAVNLRQAFMCIMVAHIFLAISQLIVKTGRKT